VVLKNKKTGIMDTIVLRWYSMVGRFFAENFIKKNI
jgi:hypothetical protein